MRGSPSISDSPGGWKPSPFDLGESRVYRAWRKRKLEAYPTSPDAIRVSVADLANPTEEERVAIREACSRANMAIYATAPKAEAAGDRAALLAFGRHFGLVVAEDHRSAERDGVVRIEVAESGGRLGYIPYTDRPIRWHTDGYYNFHGVANCIQAMLLHCAQPAPSGGENRLLDPEIAYIRLRDENPDYIAVLARYDAMAIPENIEPDGRKRPVNLGPVFFVDPATGKLGMRYTARKRNVVWRDDDKTRRAAERLETLLDNEPLTLRVRLDPGEGLICNNVLHDRSAFEATAGAARLYYRVRFHNRVGKV